MGENECVTNEPQRTSAGRLQNSMLIITDFEWLGHSSSTFGCLPGMELLLGNLVGTDVCVGLSLNN